jgi:hypothetical protein
MSLKKSREVFKAMVGLCYDEDYPELHRELISLEAVTKRIKNRIGMKQQCRKF